MRLPEGTPRTRGVPGAFETSQPSAKKRVTCLGRKTPQTPTRTQGRTRARSRPETGSEVGEILADRSHRLAKWGQAGPGPADRVARAVVLPHPPERDWDGTLMAEIGQPEREIDVRPAELPVPSELPLDPPVPAPREPAPEQEPVAP